MPHRTLRLLGDRILVKFLPPGVTIRGPAQTRDTPGEEFIQLKSGRYLVRRRSIIIDIHKERVAREAEVLQVGNGRRVGNRRIPVDVQPGDIVCVMPQFLKTKQTRILREYLLDDDEAIVHEADVLYVRE